MVCLSIPRQTVDELETPHIQRLYWPTVQWKQLVWLSKTTRPLPRTLQKYRDALLIIGTVSKGAERMFENMLTWEEMSDACVLCVPPSNPNPALQYSFSGEEEGSEFLTEHANVEVFPFPEPDIQALLTGNPYADL
jgi:hypothetical protein